jgi:molybdopterin synthase catalytic subunit
MSTPLLQITSEPLELDAIIDAAVASADATEGTGAVATFLGVVRRQTLGRRVLRLEYEAHPALAIRAFERIAAETSARWPSMRLAIHHRVGVLHIGDASVAIAAVSPRRADACAACRYAIERVKQIAPIWKHEYFEDGDAWVEGATADPDDDQARAEALRRACA